MDTMDRVCILFFFLLIAGMGIWGIGEAAYARGHTEAVKVRVEELERKVFQNEMTILGIIREMEGMHAHD